VIVLMICYTYSFIDRLILAFLVTPHGMKSARSGDRLPLERGVLARHGVRLLAVLSG
jgi:hypothetical protein